jgi:hypothetical protein
MDPHMDYSHGTVDVVCHSNTFMCDGPGANGPRMDEDEVQAFGHLRVDRADGRPAIMASHLVELLQRVIAERGDVPIQLLGEMGGYPTSRAFYHDAPNDVDGERGFIWID